jgi:hypothetical protein
MTTEAYVRDPRFEVHGVSIRWPGSERITWFAGINVKPNLDIDWRNTALLCHHTQFDGLILAHHYGIVPKMYLDTMSMGRLLLGQDVSVSLESLAKLFGLGTKTVPYDLFKGKHWHELSPAIQQAVAQGCCDDVALTWQLFCILMKGCDGV